MIEYLLGLLGPVIQIIEIRENRSVRRAEAISTIKEAIRSTKKHIDNTRNDFDDADSDELSRLWADAARQIGFFSANTARIFEMKADYWKDTNGFKRDVQDMTRKYDYRMMLTEVEKMINQIN